jgi:hypothetical protein
VRCTPYLGSKPVAAITAQELLGALRRVEARGRHETAHRVRALPGRVLRYAVATGRALHDVAGGSRGRTGAGQVEELRLGNRPGGAAGCGNGPSLTCRTRSGASPDCA